MAQDAPASTLGTCPSCDRKIGPEWLVAQYVSGARTTLLAGCPACREIVQPVRQRESDGNTD
jgi:hypothetical protein